MIGLNGGLLGSQRTTNMSTGPGVWTANEQVLLRRANTWPRTDDPYSSNITLLLRMNGNNGSTTFIDASASALTVTANGNAQISTAQSKYGGASAYFDGAGDYLQLGSSPSSLAPGTGDFTLEAWVYPTTSTGYRSAWRTSQDDTFRGIFLWNSSVNALALRVNAAETISGNSGPPANTWSHVAVVRASGVFNIYLNGVLNFSVSNQTSYSINTPIDRIGASPAGSEEWIGYIDDARFTKGIARYNATFTPPTAF